MCFIYTKEKTQSDEWRWSRTSSATQSRGFPVGRRPTSTTRSLKKSSRRCRFARVLSSPPPDFKTLSSGLDPNRPSTLRMEITGQASHRGTPERRTVGVGDGPGVGRRGGRPGGPGSRPSSRRGPHPRHLFYRGLGLTHS